MNAPLENGLSAVRKRLGGPVGRNAPIPLRRFDASFQRLGMASNAPVTDIANNSKLDVGYHAFYLTYNLYNRLANNV